MPRMKEMKSVRISFSRFHRKGLSKEQKSALNRVASNFIKTFENDIGLQLVFLALIMGNDINLIECMLDMHVSL